MKKLPDPSISPSSVLPSQFSSLSRPSSHVNRDQNSIINPLSLTTLRDEFAFLCPLNYVWNYPSPFHNKPLLCCPCWDPYCSKHGDGFVDGVFGALTVYDSLMAMVGFNFWTLFERPACSTIWHHQAIIHGLTSTHAPLCAGKPRFGYLRYDNCLHTKDLLVPSCWCSVFYSILSWFCGLILTVAFLSSGPILGLIFYGLIFCFFHFCLLCGLLVFFSTIYWRRG